MKFMSFSYTIVTLRSETLLYIKTSSYLSPIGNNNQGVYSTDSIDVYHHNNNHFHSVPWAALHPVCGGHRRAVLGPYARAAPIHALLLLRRGTYGGFIPRARGKGSDGPVVGGRGLAGSADRGGAENGKGSRGAVPGEEHWWSHQTYVCVNQGS